jgi:hypothetical protein
MSQTRVTDSSGPADDADIERLAARVAMLASEDGEADNAGRAVGALARRIGLTGGDLKRMILAGAASGSEGAGRERLEQEVSLLRQSVTLLDADARRAVRERDALQQKNERLQSSLDRLRLSAWAWGLVGAAAALVLTSFSAWIDTTGRAAPAPPGDEASREHRAAIVRPGGALLFREPERAGLPLVALPRGLRVKVRRLVWKALYQWAEVEAPDGWSGYVLTTDLDLS